MCFMIVAFPRKLLYFIMVSKSIFRMGLLLITADAGQSSLPELCFAFGHMTYLNTHEKYRKTRERHLLKIPILALINKEILCKHWKRGEFCNCK